MSIISIAMACLVTASCSLVGGEPERTNTVTLVTHESFAIDDSTRARFERETGLSLRIRKQGDAGALTNQLVLTKDDPVGDVAFGVDSTFASRALDANVFARYEPKRSAAIPDEYAVGPGDRLTPVDVGDVCVNIDLEWFARHNVPRPKNLSDLTEPRYRGLLAVPSPATSSPGLAFLLNTVETFGEPGWIDYWRKLRANDVRVSAGWQEAYNQDFSGSAGDGPRPIVLSYASSPAAEIDENGQPRTKALLNTCYRQVEYAGVLAGADDPEAARRVVDLLVSPEFQRQVPTGMYVYPAVRGIDLPPSWKKAAPRPAESAELAPERVERSRQQWVKRWRTLMRG